MKQTIQKWRQEVQCLTYVQNDLHFFYFSLHSSRRVRKLPEVILRETSIDSYRELLLLLLRTFLHAVISCKDPKSAKKLLISMLVKSNLVVNFTNILHAAFLAKVFCKAFFLLFQFGFVIFCWKTIGTKAAHKLLVKLTTG